MDERSLESFISAAYHLNFSKAAIDCHITQATLSRQIASLENEIGTELFLRHKSGVTLTPDGQYLFSCSHSLLEQLKDVAANCLRAGNALMPRLRIGLGPVEHLLLKEPLALLRQKHPFIEVACMSYTYKIMTSRFRNLSIDVGICTERCAKSVGDLDMFPIYCEPWKVVCRKDSSFRNLSSENQQQLAKQTFVTGYLNEYEETQSYCLSHRLEQVTYNETNFLQTQLMLIEAGIGIALMPPFVSDILPPDLIMEDALTQPPSPRFVLAYKPDNTNPALAAFLQICREYFS